MRCVGGIRGARLLLCTVALTLSLSRCEEDLRRLPIGLASAIMQSWLWNLIDTESGWVCRPVRPPDHYRLLGIAPVPVRRRRHRQRGRSPDCPRLALGGKVPSSSTPGTPRTRPISRAASARRAAGRVGCRPRTLLDPQKRAAYNVATLRATAEGLFSRGHGDRETGETARQQDSKTARQRDRRITVSQLVSPSSSWLPLSPGLARCGGGVPCGGGVDLWLLFGHVH